MKTYTLEDGRRVVFRVECKETRGAGNTNAGPYVLTDLAPILLPKLGFDTDDNHPIPQYDYGIGYQWAEQNDLGRKPVCCFRTMEQLTSWFMDREGMQEAQQVARIAVYACPPDDVIDGQFQSLVPADHLDMIDVLPTTCEDWVYTVKE